MRRTSRMATFAVLACLSAGGAAAQSRATSADLTGVVFDQSGAVLPRVRIAVTNTETNQVRTTVTDPTGRFMLAALPPGLYRVGAELSNFAPATRDHVLLELGSQLDLEITLQLSSLAQQITVVESAPVVDRIQTAVATVVSPEQISNLPINGRDFMSFAVITPGVARDNTPGRGTSDSSGLTFAGQRGRSNSITVDGLDNNDITVGSVRATFSQEAVREFQVLVNSYSAEFGKASGGVVNIVTKSGTNRLSGRAFYFLRDSALNAKSHFERFTPSGDPLEREKAPYGHKQFGGTLGGPLQRDRMFFFGSFERLDVDTNNFVNIDDITPLTLAGRPIGTVADVLRNAGFPVETGQVPFSVRSNQMLVNVQRQITPAQYMLVRYNFANGLNENAEPWGGLVARSRGALLDNTDNMFAASHTASFSPTTLNELRVQVARRDQKIRALDPTCGGPCTSESDGGPTIEIPGVASVGRQRFTPQPRVNDRYQALNTVSTFRGAHYWKAGVDFNYVDHKVQSLPLHFGGRYLFFPLPTIPGVLAEPVTGIQALALGLPAAYVQGYGQSSATYGYRDLALFAQDDWRVGERITLKLGVRYQKQFWPDTELNTPGVSDPYPVRADNNNVAPRLAASWVLDRQAKTVVHGAYGVYYENQITGAPGIAYIVNGTSGVRTLVTRFPATLSAWNAPGHKLPESATGTSPSLVIAIDPGLKTPYAHHVAAGIDRDLGGSIRLSANYVRVRGFNQLGTIDYNPIVTSLGPGRRPLDAAGTAGTSASVLQYTSFGETWYHGMTLAAAKRLTSNYQFLASYTLSKAEDTSTDFASMFLPQENGQGRNPVDLDGLPIGFDPASEKGPSVQDQRHRFVLSGIVTGPYAINLSTIVTVASGRPYNIIAGADLNGDGDGGTIPGPDRARREPANPLTSVPRHSGTMPMQASMDIRVNKEIPLGNGTRVEAIFEVFNVFNRVNYTDINNVFGTGPYPTSPLPTFGQFVQTDAPRQAQVAVRFSF